MGPSSNDGLKYTDIAIVKFESGPCCYHLVRGSICILKPLCCVGFENLFSLLEQHGLTAVIGIRTEGLIAASVIPLALTMVLFLGPIAMLLSNERLRMLFHPNYWSQSLTDLIWWRNHVVAPFTEELAFRYVILISCLFSDKEVVI